VGPGVDYFFELLVERAPAFDRRKLKPQRKAGRIYGNRIGVLN
jgi:hypothetical protein